MSDVLSLTGSFYFYRWRAPQVSWRFHAGCGRAETASAICHHQADQRQDAHQRKNEQEKASAFLADSMQDPLKALLLGSGISEPFAALHLAADLND